MSEAEIAEIKELLDKLSDEKLDLFLDYLKKVYREYQAELEGTQ